MSSKHPQFQHRAYQLRRFVELRAPDSVLIFSTRFLLSTLEDGTWRAIWRWVVYEVSFDATAFWMETKVWIFRHVCRMGEEAAIDRVFGVDADDEDEHPPSGGERS